MPTTFDISEYNWSDTVKDWIELPVANEQITAKQAKATAIQRQFLPRPFSIVYIGPPAVLPKASISRYFNDRVHSAYFRVVPKKAVTHIQNNAPGPP